MVLLCKCVCSDFLGVFCHSALMDGCVPYSKVVQKTGTIYVKRRTGCLSYEDDPRVSARNDI